MARIFGADHSREELLRQVGDISQIAAVESCELQGGPQQGVLAAMLKTGSGLRFTVLPGRGMDIGMAEFRGIPLSWRSPTGAIGPAFYEPEGLGWLRGFHGGMLATCGLTYAGRPTEDDGMMLGLHGRASYLPADNVWMDAEWVGDEYELWVQGRTREAAVFGENLRLTRRVSTRLGAAHFRIEDTVENLGYGVAPHMIIYHINIGFPVVSSGAYLASPTITVTPRDDDARVGAADYYKFTAPTRDYRERVYLHEMQANSQGEVETAVINPAFMGGEGIGVYVRYKKSQLPRFIEWKMMGEGAYVVGMEPANCGVIGRAAERAAGTLVTLAPGEQRRYELEIGVLAGRAQIEAFERRIGWDKSV